MSLDTKTLTAVLKAVQTATSLSGLSTLLLNSSGELVKSKSAKMPMLHEMTERTSDANALTDPGFYTLPSSAANIPPNLSRISMRVTVYAPNIYQLAVARKNTVPILMLRMYTEDQSIGWTGWYSVPLTAM